MLKPIAVPISERLNSITKVSLIEEVVSARIPIPKYKFIMHKYNRVFVAQTVTLFSLETYQN